MDFKWGMSFCDCICIYVHMSIYTYKHTSPGAFTKIVQLLKMLLIAIYPRRTQRK